MIAGSARGRRLRVPPGGVRPTADRVKESLFGALDARGLVAGAAVLDLWAGSGALAIEALSRGAARAVCVERDPAAAAAIGENLRATGLAPAGRVVRADVGAFAAGPPPPEAPFDLVCCDPPYAVDDAALAAALAPLAGPGWLAPGAVLAVERPTGAPPPPLAGRRIAWERAAGDTLVVLMGGIDA